jgi:hypothetical protein
MKAKLTKLSILVALGLITGTAAAFGSASAGALGSVSVAYRSGEVDAQVILTGGDRTRPLDPRLVPVPVERYGDLAVDVWTDAGNGAFLRPGEDVTVRFRVNRSAYVVVYDIDTRGRARLLFPTRPGDDGWVRAGELVQVPERWASYRLMVTGPAGTERIVALAADKPLVGRWERFADEDARAARFDDPGDYTRYRTRDAGTSVDRSAGTVAPRVVPVPTAPRVIPVPSPRTGISRDETWFEVAPARRWR